MKKKIILPIMALLVLCVVLFFVRKQALAPSGTNNTQSAHSTAPASTAPKSFNKSQYSTTDPTSPWIIVSKVSSLPNNYAPSDLTEPTTGGFLRQQATDALNQLTSTAAQSSLQLSTLSSYRSYATQVTTYNAYVKKDGQATADTYSARPGHSEHQTGLAVDIGNGTCDLQTCFGDTASGRWLASYAHQYGFIIRYPSGKESITGYRYEPWHLRYVGTELATELHNTNKTMEEFFDVIPAKQPY